MRRRTLVLALWLLAASCDSPSSPTTLPPPPAPELPENIAPPSRTTLLEYVRDLAADSMYGRRAGSEYERDAAEYIRARFMELGLDPGATAYMQTFDIPFAVGGETGLSSQNVVGVLPGQGSLAGQWVILGAHYDHVGLGAAVDGDAIYNGADDDASGTTAVVTIAESLAKLSTRPARSIAFELKGGREAGRVFLDELELMTIAVSLGDVDTLVSHPASMTHSTYSKEELAQARIAEGLVRLSVGLEDVDDLVYDLRQALKKV